MKVREIQEKIIIATIPFFKITKKKRIKECKKIIKRLQITMNIIKVLRIFTFRYGKYTDRALHQYRVAKMSKVKKRLWKESKAQNVNITASDPRK